MRGRGESRAFAVLIVVLIITASVGMVQAKPRFIHRRGVPFILSTNPADGQSGVLIGATYIVTWSEPMNLGTTNIAPSPIAPGVWTTGDTITWTYAGATWDYNTWYNLTFTGWTSQTGDPATGDLVKQFFVGPYDTGLLAEAEGLQVSKSGADNVAISWSNPSDSCFWNIYGGSDKLSVRQPSNLLGTVAEGVGTFNHVGAQTDGNTWYYIVVGVDMVGEESGNSSMGVKLGYTFTENPPPRTTIMWLTLPQDSVYTCAHDIVLELEGAVWGPGLDTKINMVGKWVPSGQYSTCFFYDADWEEWGGDDFTIGPGDGIFLSVTSDFSWAVCGIDTAAMLSFAHNTLPLTNIMWFNLPPTCTYIKASDIVLELEGALTGPGLATKINVVGKWLPGDQASTGFFYDEIYEEWTGHDFTITPGCGIYVSVTSNFNWTPALITPVVP